MARNGRGRVLERALKVCMTGEVEALPELFDPEVTGWSPNMLVNSIHVLAKVVAIRDGSLSELSIQIDNLDVFGNKAFAEYRVTAIFSDDFVVDEETVIRPNHREIVLGAAIVAEFTGDKISAFRNYFDDASLMDQMLAA